MARYAVEPVTFWVGMATVFVGLVVYPSPYLVWQIAPSQFINLGALIALGGWVVLFLSIAIGSSRATRTHRSDPSVTQPD
jgi:hypothetical protein